MSDLSSHIETTATERSEGDVGDTNGKALVDNAFMVIYNDYAFMVRH